MQLPQISFPAFTEMETTSQSLGLSMATQFSRGTCKSKQSPKKSKRFLLAFNLKRAISLESSEDGPQWAKNNKKNHPAQYFSMQKRSLLNDLFSTRNLLCHLFVLFPLMANGGNLTEFNVA
jgi:hypothetical protein